MTLLILNPPAVRGEKASGGRLFTPVSNGIGIGLPSLLRPPGLELGDLRASPTASGGETPAPKAVLPHNGETPAQIPRAGTIGQARVE